MPCSGLIHSNGWDLQLVVMTSVAVFSLDEMPAPHSGNLPVLPCCFQKNHCQEVRSDSGSADGETASDLESGSCVLWWNLHLKVVNTDDMNTEKNKNAKEAYEWRCPQLG